MKPNMRRNLSGVFAAHETGKGRWRLTRSVAPPIDVYLQGCESVATEVLRVTVPCDVDVEWQNGTVVLHLSSASRPQTLRASSAILHEPLPRLYADLPLASFDERARRFWRRVFVLVRIPGGRMLLRALARRARSARLNPRRTSQEPPNVVKHGRKTL